MDKKTETLNGNQLLAEFMDAIISTKWTDRLTYEYPRGKVPTQYSSQNWDVLNMQYHLSWDWLMPVIRKINGLGKEFSLAIFKNYVSCTVEKGGKFYKDFSYSHAEYITTEQDDITAAFKLVVHFVEWYNQNILKKDLEISK